MKKTITILSILIISGFVLSCASTYTGSSKPVEDYSRYHSLADILRTKGGVQVMGVGSNIKIIIRGISTFVLDTQPLYVIDGVPMGTNYNMANSAVFPANIKSVKVLANKSQTTRWGESGNNGVILINTKTDSSIKK